MFPKVTIDCSSGKYISLLVDGEPIPGVVRIDKIPSHSKNECAEITLTIVASKLEKKLPNGKIEEV